MLPKSSYKRVVSLGILLFFIFSIFGGVIPGALAGGGSGDPMNNPPPPPDSPGGTSYKSPSPWQYIFLYYFKYLKFQVRWVLL